MTCPPRRELERSIADLPAVDRVGLLHVLTCRSCRAIARRRLADEEANRQPRHRRADGTEPRYDRAFSLLPIEIVDRLAIGGASAALFDLLSLPSAERWRRLEAGEIPFNPPLAEALMALAEQSHAEPAEIVDLSSLGLRLAQQAVEKDGRQPIEGLESAYSARRRPPVPFEGDH